MMRNKIAFKLTMYFAVVLLVLALVVGCTFILLFRSNATRINRKEMARKADTIARTLGRFAAMNGGKLPESRDDDAKIDEYENYLQYLNDIAQGSVWVVNENLEIIAQTASFDGPRQRSAPRASKTNAAAPAPRDGQPAPVPPDAHAPDAKLAPDANIAPDAKLAPDTNVAPDAKATSDANTAPKVKKTSDANSASEPPPDETSGKAKRYRYRDLPPNAELVVKQVFEGQTTTSESFSGVMNQAVLTVGTPILYNDKVIGVVLLHSPVMGTEESIRSGIYILLVSIGVALLFGAALSAAFSYTFTKPLNTMKNTALQLADKRYDVKTDIRQNDEIGELAQTLDMLAGRLDEADKASEKLEQVRREYVANISHELRTPITVMRGMLEALRDGVIKNEADVAAVYDQMLSEAMSLQRMVNDLLDLSRLQNADFAIEKLPVNMGDVLSDVKRGAMHLAAAKNIKLEADEPPPCIITGDYGRLRQMLMVVLDNAVKFSPEGGSITMQVRRTGSALEIAIADEGPGIPEKELPYIFDRFYKTKSPENKNGTGLGLAIAKQIALRHGAELTAASLEGKGSKFTFTFKDVKRV